MIDAHRSASLQREGFSFGVLTASQSQFGLDEIDDRRRREPASRMFGPEGKGGEPTLSEYGFVPFIEKEL